MKKSIIGINGCQIPVFSLNTLIIVVKRVFKKPGCDFKPGLQT
ncbi:MAG: hypothetical protein ACOC6P_01960 [Candidatus Aminicenantaceae bacterium]